MTRAWIFLAAMLIAASLLPTSGLTQAAIETPDDGALAHGEGAILETMEELSNVPLAPTFRGALPARTDLTANIPSPGDQGPTGTCTSWAVTYAVGSQALRRAGLGPKLRLAPSFTYNQVAKDPICKAGTTISATLDMLRDVGALPFEQFVFDGGWCGRLATAAELKLAARYRIKRWSKVDPHKIEDVKSQLARGVPIAFNMHDEAQLQKFKGSGVLDIPGVLQGNGHAMTVVGYDDARRALRIQNSWGKEWGEGGYGWFGYDFWSRNALAGYVID